MAINEQIITGRKWRRLIDKAAGLWQRISYWTHSSDVEFEDGKNAETKVGAINGITDSLVSTSSNIAASAKALSQVNNNLMQQPEWIKDSTGKITGYKTLGGADTVFPFSSNPTLYGTYTGDRSIGIPDNLKDKNFLLVATSCRITINAGNPSGTGEFTFNPSISKSGNTLSITGCTGTKVGVLNSLNAFWSVTYRIYYC